MMRPTQYACLEADLKSPSGNIERVTNPLTALAEQLPTPPQGKQPPRAKLSLRDLLDAWKAVATVKLRTVVETEYWPAWVFLNQLN